MRRPARTLGIAIALVLGASTIALTDMSAPAESSPHPSAADQRPAVRGAAAARDRLRARLGAQAVVDLDPVTGTPRSVARLDGLLTGPSKRAAAQVALDYVRRHQRSFGIDDRDLAQLHLWRDYVDIDGTHHLVWQQRVDGVPAFDNGLRAAVTDDGRLVTVLGAPIHALRVEVDPAIEAGTALRAALRDGGATDVPTPTVAGRTAGPQRAVTFRSGDRAELVLFADRSAGGATLAWQVNARVSDTASYVSVVDAANGAVLWRTDLVHFADGTGSAWDNHPGAASGGTAEPVTFPVFNGSKLSGENAHVYADTQDFIFPGSPVPADSEIPATSGLDWSGHTTTFDTTSADRHCRPETPCTWDHTTKYSWRQNLGHTAVQVYHYVNKFHDHLLAAPIGFTPAAGNFQFHNPAGQGRGHDAVQAQIDDGADTARTLCQTTGATTTGGFPDAGHATNANMAVPQDGVEPTMQMYLWPAAPKRCADKDNAPDSNAGDDASIVYHEYTHGLSGRLVTTNTGVPAVDTFQAASMGEAWSDWYALDLLATEGQEVDGPADGDVLVGPYPTGGRGVRTEGIDCPVGSTAPACPGAGDAGPGGYTYGDVTRIFVFGGEPFPEVHADGEVWGQTLWQIRTALGSEKSLRLVTRAMELSPPHPSFLDMRNALLLADQIAYDGADAATLWGIFAERGMGYFADTDGSNDLHPTENFAVPGSCPAQCATVYGRVTDSITGLAVRGATVLLPGPHLRATTSVSGHYFLGDVPVGTYPRLLVSQRGRETTTQRALTVPSGALELDLTSSRDWASPAGGARVEDFNGSNNDSEFGCGPRRALDLSPTRGWMSDAVDPTYDGMIAGPKFLVVRLPRPVRISSVGVAPGIECGGFDDSIAVKAFTIQTRKHAGSPWRTILRRDRALPLGGLTELPIRAKVGQVRYVKIVLRSNRHQPGARDDGRMFMGLGELTVHGRAKPIRF
jgi:extracellular elastinolytic metalloproteinase